MNLFVFMFVCLSLVFIFLINEDKKKKMENEKCIQEIKQIFEEKMDLYGKLCYLRGYQDHENKEAPDYDKIKSVLKSINNIKEIKHE